MEDTTTAAELTGAPLEPPARTQVETFSAAFAPDTWDDGDSTVDCVFYSGAIVPRVDFWTGEPYDLVLSLDPGAIRMDRLNNGAPVVDNHNTFGSIRDQLGVVKPGTARVEKGTQSGTRDAPGRARGPRHRLQCEPGHRRGGLWDRQHLSD